MHKILFLLISLMILSCGQKKDIRPFGSNMICNDFYVQGQFKNAIHSFCGIVPEEVHYLHKDGKWKYWNLKGQLIAQGIYKLQKVNIEGYGGCTYELIEGVLDKKEWSFWNEKGDRIEPNEGLVNKIKSCTSQLM